MLHLAKRYDVIVIGSGSGAIVAERALWQDLSVALVDRGPLGGTCLNVGCVPSKLLIYPADRIVAAQEATKLGIRIEIAGIDFPAIMQRMRTIVKEGSDYVRKALGKTNIVLYEAEASFVDDYTLEVAGERIRGDKIFIAAGARPVIPPIPGLGDVDYLTNESVLALTKPPASLLILGGGYIAVEYAHFFAAMGTQVTILERQHHLVADEEPELSLILKRKLSERMTVHTDTEGFAVRREGDGVVVLGRNLVTGRVSEFAAERLLIAVGRQSNADRLHLQATGVEIDTRGFITVNGYLETSKANIWAFGDVIGKQMFIHVANQEAMLAWHNSVHKDKVEMDYSAVPRAIFTHPQLAAVGLTEAEAKKSHNVLVGKAEYQQVAAGEAMMETDGLAKAVVDKDSGKILGFHVIGPYASIVIQEVIDVMANRGNIHSITTAMHIHPALSELVVATLQSLTA